MRDSNDASRASVASNCTRIRPLPGTASAHRELCFQLGLLRLRNLELGHEFVKLMVSKEGQEVVIKDGYFPIPASIAKEELNKVQ